MRHRIEQVQEIREENRDQHREDHREENGEDDGKENGEDDRKENRRRQGRRSRVSFAPRSRKVVDKKRTGPVARARFQIKIAKISRSEHFWKMRSAECAPDCSQSSLSQKNCQKLARSEQPRICVVESPLPDLCGRVPIVSAARTLVDLVWRSCYAGLQPAATKRIGSFSMCLLVGWWLYNATNFWWGIGESWQTCYWTKQFISASWFRSVAIFQELRGIFFRVYHHKICLEKWFTASKSQRNYPIDHRYYVPNTIFDYYHMCSKYHKSHGWKLQYPNWTCIGYAPMFWCFYILYFGA